MMAQQRCGSKKSLCLIHKRGREHPGVCVLLKPQSLSLRHRTSNKATPDPSQRALLIGGQVFKYMSVGGYSDSNHHANDWKPSTRPPPSNGTWGWTPDSRL